MNLRHMSLAIFLTLCTLRTVLAAEPEPPPEAPEDPRAAITKTLQAFIQAHTEENAETLRGTMAKENSENGIDPEKVLAGTVPLWESQDVYAVLKDVEILDDSESPKALFDPPYATALLTMSEIELHNGDERNVVFYRRCKKPDCDPVALAEKMEVARDVYKVQVEVLLKQEDGEWKVVAPILEREAVNARGWTSPLVNWMYH